MKIGSSQLFAITLKQGKESASLFDAVKTGDRVPAKILSRDGNSAELEILGRKITAEFIRGIPSGDSVELILSEKTPDRIAFSIASKPGGDELMKLFLPLSVLSENGLKEFQIHNLVKFLSSGRVDLMSLNLFLAGIKRDEKSGRTGAEIFNYLLSRGISYSTLADLSFILGGKAGEILLAAYNSFIKPDKKGLHGWNSGNIDEKTELICRELAGDTDASAEIIDMLITDAACQKGYGDIPFPDGEGFRKLEYVLSEDSIFFNIELTELGDISALIRGNKNGSFINIFSENDDSLGFLKERIDILRHNLDLMGVKKPLITFYNSKKVIDKIDIWRTDFYIKRDFDVKI